MSLLSLIPIGEKIIDGIFPDKTKAAEAKRKLLQAEREGKLKQAQVQMSAILAEAQSKDPWTSRARPTFLYLFYAVIALCFIGGIAGIWWPDNMTQAATNIRELLSAIPKDMWWLFGAGYLGYAGARSYDKRNITRAESSDDKRP